MQELLAGSCAPQLFLHIHEHADLVGRDFKFLVLDTGDLECRQRTAILISEVNDHFPIPFTA